MKWVVMPREEQCQYWCKRKTGHEKRKQAAMPLRSAMPELKYKKRNMPTVKPQFFSEKSQFVDFEYYAKVYGYRIHPENVVRVYQ